MSLPTLLFCCALLMEARLPNRLEGTWENQNPSSGGVTHIVVNASNNGSLQARVWGKCEPSDCDWGAAEIKGLNGLEEAIFDLGFASTTIDFVLLPDGRLLAAYKTTFKDHSGRVDQDQAEFFARETQPIQDADWLAATALLKRVAETYRHLASAQFESVQEIEHLERQSAVQSKRISRTLISEPGRIRIETTGSAEPRVTISNGDTVWTYFPASNEYNSSPAGKQGFLVTSPVSSYALLDQLRESGKVSGHGRIDDVDCTIVTIGRNDAHRRNLWIDPKTNFVRKDDSKDISTVLGGAFSERSVTTFSLARGVDKLDPTLFSFDPTITKARLRSELQKDAPTTSIGTLAPDFTLRNLEGRDVRLSELRGNLVILDFWATWCGPCRSAMPALELLHRQFKDKGVVVLGIDDEDAETQKAYERKFGYSFSALVDPEGKIANLYKVGGIPTTVLIDSNGIIKTYDVGEATFESMFDTLNAEALARRSK